MKAEASRRAAQRDHRGALECLAGARRLLEACAPYLANVEAPRRELEVLLAMVAPYLEEVMGTPTDPAPEPRPWEPLLQGAGLEGWRVRGPASLAKGRLRLDAGASLVTERSWGDVTYAASARPATEETAFALAVRAGEGPPGVELEVQGGRCTLRLGTRTEALAFRWEPGREHMVVLLVAGQEVLAYIDRQKVAGLIGAGLPASGGLGAACRSGSVELSLMYAQPLD
jgi:hypothetical protein